MNYTWFLKKYFSIRWTGAQKREQLLSNFRCKNLILSEDNLNYSELLNWVKNMEMTDPFQHLKQSNFL